MESASAHNACSVYWTSEPVLWTQMADCLSLDSYDILSGRAKLPHSESQSADTATTMSYRPFKQTARSVIVKIKKNSLWLTAPKGATPVN